MSTGTETSKAAAEGGSNRRVVTRAGSLEALIGSHPDALRKIYAAGRPADPGDLGDLPRGRVLAVEPLKSLFLLARPIVRALGNDFLPWQGKVFDHGGNSGMNRVFGKQVLRFHAEAGASAVDGKPTLILRYDDPAFGNPWPMKSVVDELRSIGEGLAIGPALFGAGDAQRVVLWWGLSGPHGQ
jgi:hypothetical protein